MALYQSGDDKAFEVLYKRHSGRVMEFLEKRTNPQIAVELLQESFLKVHKSRHQYSTQYPFLPWLFAITRNTLFDFSRLNETKITKKSGAEIEVISSDEPQPVLTLSLKTLSQAQRRAIELRYLNDWSFQKIATDMETTTLNARQLVSRGIKKLRSGFGGKS